MEDTAVQDSGTWDDRKGQRRRLAGLRAAAPQRTPLHGTVAMAAILAVEVETPASAGHSARDPSPGPQVPLPPRADDSDRLLLSQAVGGCWDPRTAN